LLCSVLTEFQQQKSYNKLQVAAATQDKLSQAAVLAKEKIHSATEPTIGEQVKAAMKA